VIASARATLAVVLVLAASHAASAHAQERADALTPPRPGSTVSAPPILEPPERPPELPPEPDRVLESVVARPLVLPPLVARGELTLLVAGSSTYTPTFGLIPALAVGVAPGLELSTAVPFLIGENISPNFGAHFRYFASRPVELGVRALVAIPTTSAAGVTTDGALTLLWHAHPQLALSTEARVAFAFTTPLEYAFVWPVALTFQATSGFFVGATSELAVLRAGHVAWAPGVFLGGTLATRGHAVADVRFALAIRDVAARDVGVEVLLSFAFYFGDLR